MDKTIFGAAANPTTISSICGPFAESASALVVRQDLGNTPGMDMS